MVSFMFSKEVPWWEASKNESMHSWNPRVNGWSGRVSICRSYGYPESSLSIMSRLIYLSFYIFTVFSIEQFVSRNILLLNNEGR